MATTLALWLYSGCKCIIHCVTVAMCAVTLALSLVTRCGGVSPKEKVSLLSVNELPDWLCARLQEKTTGASPVCIVLQSQTITQCHIQKRMYIHWFLFNVLPAECHFALFTCGSYSNNPRLLCGVCLAISVNFWGAKAFSDLLAQVTIN